MGIQSETRRQLFRYALTGLVSNSALYAGYLLLTAYGAGHKSAMTVVYCVGVIGTFALNRLWTFGHHGAISPALTRYAATYLFVYALNMASLELLVDTVGLPHQWVVLVLTVTSAVIIFLLQKFWAFAVRRETALG